MLTLKEQNEEVNEGVISQYEGVTDFVKKELVSILNLFIHEEGMKLKDIALKIGLFSHNYRALFRNLKGFVFD